MTLGGPHGVEVWRGRKWACDDEVRHISASFDRELFDLYSFSIHIFTSVIIPMSRHCERVYHELTTDLR